MAQFVEVCGAAEVPEGRGKGVTIDGLSVALFRDPADPEAIIALHGRCPHANGPMGRAWVDDGQAICPLHRWRFDLRTGRCTTAPDRALHRFRCEVRAGRVWVEV